MANLAPMVLEASEAFPHERREAFLLPTAAGHSVGATLHTPVRSPPSEIGSLVLLLPGWSGPRTGPAELLVFLAQILTVQGHTALRVDLHGRGDSTGQYEDGDLDRMIQDAGAAADWLRAKYPDARLTAGGICSGGNVALGLASLRPKDVAAVVALSTLPFQPARGAAFERRRRWRNFKQYVAKAFQPATWGKLLRGEVNLGRVKENLTVTERKPAGERNPKDSARDIEKELLAWKGRALFVWGGGDDEAPPARAHYEKLHAAGCAAEARFEQIAGANHNFYNRAWREELAAKLAEFLKTGER